MTERRNTPILSHAFASTPTRRRVLIGGAGAIALAAAPRVLRAAAPGRIVMMMPNLLSPSFADVLVAAANGHFKNNGLDVDLQGTTSGVQPLQNVITGQVQLARTGTLVLVQAINKGAKCKAIASIAQGSSFFLVSSASHPVNVPKDLVGGTIGVVSLRGPMDLMLDAMLSDDNIDPKSVSRQVVADNPGSVALLDAGRIKAYFANSETIARAKAAGAKLNVVDPQPYLPLPSQVYLAADEEISTNEATFVAFIKAVRSAIADIIADKDLKATIAALRKLPSVGGLDNEANAAAAIRANLHSWLAAGPENLLRNIPERWAKGMAAAVRIGASSPLPPERLYTNAIVDKAMA